jgi:PAS fold/ANTAR domain
MTRRAGHRVDLHSVPASADATGDGDGLAAVSPQGVGWFRFYFDDRRWEWSEQVQRLHGYEPGTVSPTTELVLSHKHPDDRDQVAATIDDIMHTRGALSSRHRIIDTDGAVHWVVIIGDQFLDSRGVAIGTHGFYVDITPIQRSREDTITARLGEITDKRAPIEQVKGMLMLVYDLDDAAAIDLLKWLSQESNVKLRVLAERISTTLRATARDAIVDRAVFDHALITAHRLSDCGDPVGVSAKGMESSSQS